MKLPLSDMIMIVESVQFSYCVSVCVCVTQCGCFVVVIWSRYYYGKEFWPIRVRRWHFETVFCSDVMLFFKMKTIAMVLVHWWTIVVGSFKKKTLPLIEKLSNSHLLMRRGRTLFQDSTYIVNKQIISRK